MAQSSVPVPKVVAATVGAAAATVLCLVYSGLSGNEIPAGLEGALATLLAFAAGYLKSDPRADLAE